MKKTLTLPYVNILYFVAMILVLVLGSVIQLLSLTLGLIGTEFLLILLPTVLFLRSRGIPLREGLRLRKLDWGTALLCVLLGVGTWAFSIYIEGLMMQISGMVSVNIANESLPQGPLQLALYFIAIAISAPICEEALFRGAIQGAYENHRSKWFAITITALMFAFFHFRLSGLPALIPVAFLLGYMVWRTQSLLAGVLIHFGMNASAGINTIVSLSVEGFAFPLTSLWVLVAGLVIAGFVLWLLIRRVPAPVKEEHAAAEPVAELAEGEAAAPAFPQSAQPLPTRPSWLVTYWPLGAAGLLYLMVACLTLIPVMMPELTAQPNVTFTEAKWDGRVENHYQITNRAGEDVGDLTCRVEPGGETVRLDCRREVRAYDITVGLSQYIENDHVAEWSAEWDARTLNVLDYTYTRQVEGQPVISARVRDGMLAVDTAGTQMETDLPERPMLQQEWPWRCGHLNVMTGLAYKVPFTYNMRWDEETQESQPMVITELLRAYPLDTVTVPAGRYDTWKVTVGDQETAWYANSDPTLLVQYDDGMMTYSLK